MGKFIELTTSDNLKQVVNTDYIIRMVESKGFIRIYLSNVSDTGKEQLFVKQPLDEFMAWFKQQIGQP